jgi:exopolysaccharide production protein ExoQ
MRLGATKLEWYYAIVVLVVTSAVAFIVGTQEVGFDSLNPVSQLENVQSGGDELKQIILLSLYLGCPLLLYRTPLRLCLYLGAPLLLLMVLCFASTIWSVNPSVSIRRCIALSSTVLFGIFLGLRFDFPAMIRLLTLVGAILLLGSLFYAAVRPSIGIDADNHLRGIFEHKNALANFCAVLVLVCIGRVMVGRYSIALPLSLLAIFCMVMAQSSAVIPVLMAAVAALLAGRLIRFASPAILALSPMAICAAITGGMLVSSNIGSLAEEVGRDPDMSGRTLVWTFVGQMIAKQPWLGYGYSAFWVGYNSPGAAFWENTHLGVPHAHNGFLQLTLDAGGVGLLLFCLAVGVTAIKLIWLLRYTRQPLVEWAFALLAFDMVTNLSESWLWSGNVPLVAFFVYIVVRTNLTVRRVIIAQSWSLAP